MGGVTDLLDEARDAGLVVRVDGDRLVVRGPRSAEAVARRLLENKPAVMETLARRFGDSQSPTTVYVYETSSKPEESIGFVDIDTEVDWRGHINDQDREYLLGPEVDDPPTGEQLARLRAWRADRYPGRCFFCGGRKVHNPDCFIATYEPVLPFGRYKNRLVSEVPMDYLRWLIKNSTSLSPDLRVEIERGIQKVKSAPRVLQSTGESTLMNEPPGSWQHSQAALTAAQPRTGGSRRG